MHRSPLQRQESVKLTFAHFRSNRKPRTARPAYRGCFPSPPNATCPPPVRTLARSALKSFRSSRTFRLQEYVDDLFPRLLRGDEFEIGYGNSQDRLDTIGKQVQEALNKMPVKAGAH